MKTLNKKPIYTSGVASKILGINQKTIINYENAELIKIKKNENGRRLFSQNDLFEILLIKWLIAKKGLNMKGIKVVLKLLMEANNNKLNFYGLVIPQKIVNKFIEKITFS